MKSGEAIARIDRMICDLTQKYHEQTDLIESLKVIQSIINSLEEA